ncbi:uncharacterized protein LOC118087708 isoform X1 [Zootoca vivipara]|uniref:uncharacterized protein LOC118087708 isoform X1 n=1 Tax=Zootoca vivipara TaxID=8524 RepID=UPI001591DE85|nr:uncharacterized protein LOC118087708 isoform X1 [Zootoca vivipara]
MLMSDPGGKGGAASPCGSTDSEAAPTFIPAGSQDPPPNHHEVLRPHTVLGRPDRELLEDVFFNISRRLQNLNKELPDEIVEAFDVFVGVPALVVEKAITALYDLRRHGRHNLEALDKALQSALAGYVDPILERVGPYAATVRSAVVAQAQDINHKIDEKLPQQVQTLRTQLDPHFKKLRELQADLQPYFDHTQELIRKGVETIHKHLLKPYIGPIVQLRQKYKDDFRAWARAPVFSPNP